MRLERRGIKKSLPLRGDEYNSAKLKKVMKLACGTEATNEIIPSEQQSQTIGDFPANLATEFLQRIPENFQTTK